MKNISVLAVLALAISVSGCASAPATQNVASDLVCKASKAGEASSKIKVTGQDGEVPTVDFETPLDSKSIETSVINEGTGPVFKGNQFIEFEFIALNGTTGEVLTSSSYNGTDFGSQMVAEGGYPDFCHALSGVKEGSRVAMLFPASFSHDSQPSDNGLIAADDSIVYVLDLLKIYPYRASGKEMPAEAGFPTITRGADGTPAITQVGGDAPSEFKVSTLIKGDGAIVQEGQRVTVQYSGFIWGGDKFDSSWDRQAPSQFELSKGQVIDGFVKAIAGQAIGSQVIAVIPPDLGYGDKEQSGIPANSTLIFVIDILGAN